MIVPEPLAAAPDPETARHFMTRLRQDFPSAYRSHPGHPRRPAMCRQPLLLQPLSLRVGLARSGTPPRRRCLAQLQQRPHAGELPRAPLQFPGRRRAVGRRFRALPASTVTAHPAPRRTRRRHPVQHHRGIVQPRRRHPRRGLPPHPRGVGGAPRRAPPRRRLACAASASSRSASWAAKSSTTVPISTSCSSTAAMAKPMAPPC